MYLKKSIPVIVFILFMTRKGVSSTISEHEPPKQEDQSLQNANEIGQLNLGNIPKRQTIGESQKQEVVNPSKVENTLHQSKNYQEEIESVGSQSQTQNKLLENHLNKSRDSHRIEVSVDNQNQIIKKKGGNGSKIMENGFRNSNNDKLDKERAADSPDSNETPGQDIQPVPNFEPQRIISFVIYVCLAISGIYVSLFGFRIFRLLMVILGFYVSYYGILFVLTELKVYHSNEIGHQMGLFFGCIILGFIISMLCYIFDKANVIILGMAIASVIALFAAQFFIDFKERDDRIIFAGIYFVSALVASAVAYFTLDHFIIWGSALAGAIITPINIGVIFGDFKSFECRKKMAADRWKNFRVYLLICGLVFITGLCAQYVLRRRIIKRMQDSSLEEIRGTSFLN
jgi:hypothetical protein